MRKFRYLNLDIRIEIWVSVWVSVCGYNINVRFKYQCLRQTTLVHVHVLVVPPRAVQCCGGGEQHGRLCVLEHQRAAGAEPQPLDSLNVTNEKRYQQGNLIWANMIWIDKALAQAKKKW